MIIPILKQVRNATSRRAKLSSVMNKSIVLFFLLSLVYTSHSFSQIPSTIGEIFNFDINDEFHTKWLPPAPPNAKRILITNKYYGQNSDTLYYIRSFSNYSSVEVDYPEPHLEYSFEYYIDTVFYTSLDSSIVEYLVESENIDLEDTLEHIEYTSANNESLCNIQTDNILRFKGWDYHGDSYIYTFSPGLGQTYFSFFPEAFPEMENSLFFFKKGEYICGTPDLVNMNIKNEVEHIGVLHIYPNPCYETIKILGIDIQIDDFIFIYDSNGRLIREFKYSDNYIDIKGLISGFYHLVILKDSIILHGSFIKINF